MDGIARTSRALRATTSIAARCRRFRRRNLAAGGSPRDARSSNDELSRDQEAPSFFPVADRAGRARATAGGRDEAGPCARSRADPGDSPNS